MLDRQTLSAWDKAIGQLKENISDSNYDGPSLKLCKKCQKLLAQPANDNWSTITSPDGK